MSKEGPPLQRHEQKSTSGAEREQAEEIKQHFGHCFEISKIDNGDQIPVGGSNFLASETDIKVTGDFEQFKPFFSEAHKQAAAYKLPELRKWLNSQDIDCDEKLFATLSLCFHKKIRRNVS